MSYPPAPWQLQGYSLQTLHLLDIERVRATVPASLKVFAVLPGKTLGGVYAAAYGVGSTLIYSELIIVNGLLTKAGKVGSWISHIYVDQPDSVAGGREIWGLPKQMAQFEWDQQGAFVQVKQDNQTLCVIDRKWHLPGVSQSLSIPAFGMQQGQLLRFWGRAHLKAHLAGVNLTIPSDSPIAELQFGQPRLGFYANPLRLQAEAPMRI